jgi:DNA-binding winged helix-turn-helix (wHTH) protein/TolB-like protein/Flp pilus assembly protein TadD
MAPLGQRIDTLEESEYRTIRFDQFELNPGEHWLRGPDGPLHLQPKSFETLVLLAQHPGELVGKEELMSAIWPNQVVSDNALTRCIRDVRRVLGDSAGRSRYIETVPKLGYRFIAPISNEASSHEVPAFLGPPDRRIPGLSGRPGRQLLAGLIFTLALVLAYWSGVKRDATPPETAPTSIAIIPFSNHTADHDNEYLVDGIVNGVMERLSTSRGLKVIALRSAGRFRDTETRLDEMFSQLNVEWLVTGELEERNGQAVIQASLVNLDGEALWNRVFRLVSGDALSVQEELSAAIAETLQLELSELSRYLATSADLDSINAHRLYLLGYGHMSRRLHREILEAVKLFEQTLELKPDHAGALAALGVCYLLGPPEVYPPEVAKQRAEVVLKQAMEIDPLNALAYSGMALLKMMDTRTTAEALPLLEKALALDPNDVNSLVWFATVLGNQGRFGDAFRVGQIALRLDPLHGSLTGNLSFMMSRLGRYEEALELISSDNPMFAYFRFSLLMALGRHVEAMETARREVLRYPRNDFALRFMARVMAVLQWEEESYYWADQAISEQSTDLHEIGGHMEFLLNLGDAAGIEAMLARMAAHPQFDESEPGSAPDWLLINLSLARIFLGDDAGGIRLLTEVFPDPAELTGWQGDYILPAGYAQHLALALQNLGEHEPADAWLASIASGIQLRRLNGSKNFIGLMLVEAANLALLGDTQASLDVLEEIETLGWHDLNWLENDLRLAPLREHPRFGRLLQRVSTQIESERAEVLAGISPGEFRRQWEAAQAAGMEVDQN